MQNETTAIAIVIGSVQRKRYVEQKHKSGKTQVSKEPECNREETDFRPWHLDNTNTSFYIVRLNLTARQFLCVLFFFTKKKTTKLSAELHVRQEKLLIGLTHKRNCFAIFNKNYKVKWNMKIKPALEVFRGKPISEKRKRLQQYLSFSYLFFRLLLVYSSFISLRVVFF